jgi:hypothetical protein
VPAAVLGPPHCCADRVHVCNVVEGWDYGWTLVPPEWRELHQVGASPLACLHDLLELMHGTESNRGAVEIGCSEVCDMG